MQIIGDASDRAGVEPVATTWADAAGWRLTRVESTPTGTEVRATGPLPAPDAAGLRRALRDAGMGDVPVSLVLVPSQTVKVSE